MHGRISKDYNGLGRIFMFNDKDEIADGSPHFQLISSEDDPVLIYVYIHHKRKNCSDCRYDLFKSFFSIEIQCDYDSCNVDSHEHGDFLPALLTNHQLKYDPLCYEQLSVDARSSLNKALDGDLLDKRFSYEVNPDKRTYIKEATW